MTIGFGVATANEWLKSTWTHHIREHLWNHFLTHFDPIMFVLCINSALIHHVTLPS